MADRLEIADQDRSTGTIVRDIIRDAEEMIRSEVKLAKTELQEKARTAAEAGGWLAAAAGAALFAGACFVVTMIAALMVVLPLWLAALIMAVLLSAMAAALFLHGRDRMKRSQPVLRQTTETLREGAQWLKRQAS
jgi:uncharacterized membrane protein YqjE